VAITAPLRISSSGAFINGATGLPEFLAADSFPTLHVNLSQTDRLKYLDWLRANGFNSFWLMFAVRENAPFKAVNPTNPNNFDGVAPYSTAGHVATVNQSYIDDVAALVENARVRDIYVQLHPHYNGFGGTSAEGWADLLDNGNNSDTDYETCGAAMAATLTHPNILWGFSGDYTIPAGTRRTRYRKLMDGINSTGPRRLWWSELDNPDTIATDQAGFTFGSDPFAYDHHIMSFYGVGAAENGLSAVTARRAWDAGVGKYAVMGQETPYIANGWNPFPDRSGVRRVDWWALVGGGMRGLNVGDDDRFFLVDGLDTLTRASTMDAVHRLTFVRRVPFHLMAPSGTQAGRCGRVLIPTGANEGTNTEVVSCMATTGTHIVAYWPNTLTAGASATFDLRSMANRPIRAYWFDPTTGAVTYDQGGAYAYNNTMSAQSFTLPALNGAGETDMAFVLEAAPAVQAVGASRSTATGPVGRGGFRMVFG